MPFYKGILPPKLQNIIIDAHNLQKHWEMFQHWLKREKPLQNAMALGYE